MREKVAVWLQSEGAASHYVSLVREGGSLDSEEREQVFGESLPPGLRLS